MAVDATKVHLAASGVVSHAPLATALPTDTTTALNVAFLDVGYISEDGVEIDPTTARTEVKAWGGVTVRSFESEFGVELKFTMLETNDNSTTAYYGTGTATSTKLRAGSAVRKSWVIHVVDGATKYRYVVPDGEVTGREAIKLATSDPIAYGITITAYPNSSGDNVIIYSA